MVKMSKLHVKLLWATVLFVLMSVATGNEFRKIYESFLCNYGKSEEEIIDVSSLKEVVFKDLPCASLLLNPCPMEEFYLKTRPSSDKDFNITFFRHLSLQSTNIRDIFFERQQKYSFCNMYETSTLADIPTYSELKEMTTQQALRRIRQSLLAHIEQALISDFKFNYTDVRCFGNADKKNWAIFESVDMIFQLSRIACGVHARMNLTEYQPIDVTKDFNELVSKPSLCIEGTLLFCLVSSSSQRLLKEVAKYAMEQMKYIDPVEYEKSSNYRPFWSDVTKAPPIVKPANFKMSKVKPPEL